MRLVLDLDTTKCTACGACSVACMDQNDTDLSRGMEPFRAVFDWERRETGSPVCFGRVSIACMHCEDAPCVLGCPCGCIAKDPATGLTVYDTEHCVGCHSCAMACPFGAPSFGEDGKMVKCDGCAERLRHGLEPACVRVCPTGALRVLPEEELAPSADSLQTLGGPFLDAQV